MKRDTDTLLPPPAPSAAAPMQSRLGLWAVCTADAKQQGKLLDCASLVSATVGRGKSAVWQVEDGWLSREHFRISPVDGEALGQGPWDVQDLDTRNGTWLNGKRVKNGVARPGDVIRAGASVFVVGFGATPEADLGIAGCSLAAAELRRQISQIAPTGRPIHITGESGVGKEVLAEAIHRASGRRGAFLAVNSAALVHNLAESQLFGHRRGAFSGADKDSPGAFDVASGGTLLLDEIGELDLALQAKLLRVVECGEVHRLGDPRPHAVDVRLVTATHRTLDRQVRAGLFREDLYWRIAHTIIEVPPLRERRLDVVPIVDSVLESASVPGLTQLVRVGGRAAWQAAELVERFLTYAWPGNVRELRDEVLRLGDLIAIRRRNNASSPLPALEDALSARVQSLTARGFQAAAPAVRAEPPEEARSVYTPHGVAADDTRKFVAHSPAEVARAEALLHDKDALLKALRGESGGNIRAMADKLALALGRQPDTIRRQIYRVLGDALATVRRADTEE